MKKAVLLSGLIAAVACAGAQVSPLSLDSCYARAVRQYPLISQRGLIEKGKDYNVSNVSKGYLPQLSFNGQATYQSAVTSIPLTLPPSFGNFSIPTPSKDQYNIHGEINQVIYDGGLIRNQKQVQESNAEIQEQNLSVQLYALRERVNQVFFGILLLDGQVKQNELLQKDLKSSIEKMQVAVNAGTVLESRLNELQAELIQQEQNLIQLKASRKAYLDMLAQFVNQSLDENTVLQVPPGVSASLTINRPELLYYDIQKKSYDAQDRILKSNNLPRLSFFFQGGYARPGLNAFDTKFEPYYISGFRLSWSLAGYYTYKNNRQLLDINRQTLDLQKETFLFNTRLTLSQQQADVQKLQQMIVKDNDIIRKRTAVKDAAKAQLDNGVITVHDYISELNAEDLAKQNLLLHQVQLLLAEYSLQNTSGN